METEVFEEEQRCLNGVPCLRISSSHKDEIARIFGDYERSLNSAGRGYNLTCCYGFSIDLMENVASDLDLRFQVSLLKIIMISKLDVWLFL